MDRITDAATLAATVREALPAGFVLDEDVPTGGGCAAMRVTAPDGRELWVTDGDGGLPFSGAPGDWDSPDDWGGLCIAYYERTTGERVTHVEPDGWLTATPASVDAENVRTWVRAWVEADPWRDAV